MKRFLIIAVLIVSSFVSQAQELKWHTDVSDAAKIALEENKPLLLFFTGSDWCGWCIKLQKEVFKTPEFAKWASENVILLELDFPRRTPQSEELKKQNYSLQQMFGVTGYPTIWFVNPVQKEGKKVNLDALGSMGYERGGPSNWLASANKVIRK